MNVTLTVEQSGLRADQYLAGVLDGLTRSAAQAAGGGESPPPGQGPQEKRQAPGGG